MKAKSIILYCLCLLFCSNLQANLFVIEQSMEAYDLQPAIQVLEDQKGTYWLQDLNSSAFQAQFQTYSKTSFTLKPATIYWGKIQIENRLPNAQAFSEWVLKLSNTWTTLDVFIQNADGTFTQQRSGTFVPHAEKSFGPTTEGNLIKLSLLPGAITTIYFRGKSDRASIPPSFQTSLQHTDNFYRNLQNRKTSTSIFIGFVLMMLLYNLILYFFGRDRSYIFYSIYLLSLVIYASFISEDLADWFESCLFPNHPEYLYFGKFVIYFGLMAYLAFMHSFLDLEKLLPKWNRYFKFLFYLGIPLMILDLILVFYSNFSYVVADKVTVSYIVLFVISVFIFVYPLSKTI